MSANNNVLALMRKAFARAVMNNSGLCIVPSLVSSDISDALQNSGTTVDVPVSGSSSTQAVAPSVTSGAPTATVSRTVPVTLDQWEEALPFSLTDLDMNRINQEEAFVPMALNDAMNALRERINADLFSDYWRVYNVIGSPGTTPFASNQLNLAATIRNQFDTQKANGDRFVILDGAARTNALSTADFSNADKRGNTDTIDNGGLGRVFGVNYFYDQQVPRHVSTALTAGACTVNGANAVGATTISINKLTNASPLVRGDILTFAGDSQQYTVTAAVTLAVGNTSVSIDPPIAVAKTGGEAVTLAASHRVNLGFVRPAFAYANRQAGNNNLLRQAGRNIISMADPLTGSVFSLELRAQAYQVAWHLSALWGKRIIKPEWMFRLAGA